MVGVAPSGRTADVLAAETSCRTVTLAKYLADAYPESRTLPPVEATVVVDEAGMANTADLPRLVQLAQVDRKSPGLAQCADQGSP